MTFGILVFDQVEELDFVGPWELVVGKRRRHSDSLRRIETRVSRSTHDDV